MPAAGVLVLSPVLGVVLLGAAQHAAAVGSGGGIRPGSVPAEYVAALQKAAADCPSISAPLLAAQIQVESGWNPAAVSPAGAEGLSQFLPGTWAVHGLDGDGDGVADPFDAYDAITSQAAYDCELADAVAGVPGDDRTGLMLAAYNAGPGAVLAFGGVPPYPETVAYVSRIEALVPVYSATSPGGPPGPGTGGAAGAALAAAETMIGTPYVWGGDEPGGFDCSGLTSWAYAQAGVTIPRTSQAQQAFAVPVADPQPGDLVFFGTPATHVGMYLGGGQMLDAPHTGALVRVEAVWDTVSGYGRVA